MSDPLKRKPVFGDVEQIEAIKAIRREETDNEGKTKFSISVYVSHSEEFCVWAEDKEEASEIARECIEIDNMDVDVTIKEVLL